MTTDGMRVAFLGLGAMGQPMAANIAAAGHALTVWNRRRKPLDGFDPPPRWAATVAEAARDAEVVVTMLADDAATEAVAADGLIDALAPDAVHVSCGTLSVAAARRLAEAHARAGRAYVAAPVFGRPDIARARRLWVVAAGPEAARARARPVLQAIGRGVSEFGEEAWHANLVKIGNNFLLAAMLEALGEATALMRRGGVDPAAFLEAANNLFASPVYASYGAQVASGRHDPALFKLQLGLKDARLALAAADALGVPMPLASLTHDTLLQGLAQGRGEQDWSALAAVAQGRAGLDPAEPAPASPR